MKILTKQINGYDLFVNNYFVIFVMWKIEDDRWVFFQIIRWFGIKADWMTQMLTYWTWVSLFTSGTGKVATRTKDSRQ